MTYGKYQGIEKNSDKIEGLSPSPKEEVAGLEVVRSHGQAKKRDETIGSHSWDTTGGDQRSECNLTGKDGAQNQGTKYIHDSDGIARLPRTVNLSDPRRQRENTVTGNSEN